MLKTESVRRDWALDVMLKIPYRVTRRFLKTTLCIVIVLLLAFVAIVCRSGHAGSEAYRIRIHNRVGGIVQVSTDGGKSYGAVGRVTAAASTRVVGFAAASYAPRGTVAATAIHGLRIKVGQLGEHFGKAQMPLIFSIAPAEFFGFPENPKLVKAQPSAIHTDIYSGHSIFRNQSPFVGNPVFVERGRHLQPLPMNYAPMVGDVFVIVVELPTSPPEEVDFENKIGGRATARYADGRSEEIARVIRPVKGAGRYDGTTFTGVGAINTNHCGVVTFSTAPLREPGIHEGGPEETRGGFMVQPCYHVKEQGETRVQVMVICPIEGDDSKPVLEGTPPLYLGNINLSWYPAHPENSYRVQVKIDNGDWEQVPQVIGRVDDAFTARYLQAYFARKGQPRQVKEGVTAVRLVFAKYDAPVVAADLAREVSEYTARALKFGVKAQKGTVLLSPRLPSTGRCSVSFYVDGRLVNSTNQYPYRCEWDTMGVTNGYHAVEIETTPESGAKPAVEHRDVLVFN